MSDSFSTVADGTIHHPSPPAFFPYRFDADDSPALPASPASTATIPVAGPYARVTPSLARYLMASASSFCGHLGYTPVRVLGAPPLPSAVPGSNDASMISGWRLELDTLPLAESACQTVDMMFYMGNCCINDLFARTIAEMRGCPDITIVSDLAIPLVVWFVATYGQRYPDWVELNTASLLHTRLVTRLNRAIRGNRGRRDPHRGRTRAQIQRARTSRARYQALREERLAGRMRVLVGEFLDGMSSALDGLIDPQDRLCYQQVHDGQEEACMSALADLGLDLDWSDF